MAFLYSRPDADTITGSWKNETQGATLFDSVDETVADDANYIISTNNPNNDTCKLRLSDPGASITQPVKIRYRYQRHGETDQTLNLLVQLLQASTLIAQWGHNDIGTSLVTSEQTLTAGEFAAISDVNDLYLQFNAYSLPSGVTLTDIDGGPTYYADHGFTYAVNAGWDDPTFFPISMFLEAFRDSTDAAKWNELGCNTALAVQGGVDLPLLAANGTFLIIQAGEWLVDGGNNLYHATLGAETVGINAVDEPGTYAECIAPIQNFPNAQQDHRFFYENYTHNAITFGDVGGHDMDDLLDDLIATPNATTRHLDLASVDVYFFAGAVAGAAALGWAGNIYNLGRDMTTDEMSRGCRYRDIIYWMRKGNPIHSHAAWQTTYPAPMSVFVETGTPYAEDTNDASAIRPAEINAAVWGSIIGGARHVQYFTLGDAGAWDSSGLIKTAFWDTPVSGESISNYDQVAATNVLVTSLATVLNSPFAIDYITCSPPPVIITSSVTDSGFEVMAKYHNVVGGDNKFYIFAMPRYSQSTTNQVATFTIKNTGSTQVTVINESRTISVTNGGTQFVDTFANGNTIHIYRVD